MASEWFYWSGGRQQGPVDETHLRQLAESGTLRPEELIWNASMKDWRPAGEATDWRFGPAPITLQSAGAPPTQTLAYVAQSDEQLVLSPRIVDLMVRTAPWVRFLGVMGYICAGLMGVAGLGMIIIGSARGTALGGNAIGAIYVVLGVIYVFPANYLNSYATRIGRLRHMKRNVDLEEAIDTQRAFWKFCGILTLVVIGLYFLFIAIAIIVDILSH